MNHGPVDHQALLAEALTAVRGLRQRVAELEQGVREPIAIVGMSCRLPGGVDSIDDFWTALESGRELLEDVPRDRWDHELYYDALAGTPGKICTRRGGFVAGKDRFDASFFRISPREAVYIDPQQRLLLEAAWEALEHANIPAEGLYATEAGVFVGISSFDYAGLVFGEVADTALDHVAGTGSAHSAAAGRISYALGLHGPSLSVDTACSSSLVAVHLACESLRRGECSLALVGGVNMVLSPLTNIVFSRAHMLSPDGRCKTFDDAADGYARSDGAAVVVLKKLSAALAAGNRVLAVIRGAAVNQDGPSGGLTVPNGPAQQRVVLRALQNAGVAPADVGYIEAHGTGTPLGDPIEINALGEIFRATHDREARPLFVGSAKTNVGHMEAAAGVGGLIKLVLQLQRGSIAPHLNVRTPSRRIAWNTLPVRIPNELLPWPRYGERRVGGVSSFGFTGTNAHVVVEEAPPRVLEAPRATRSHHVLCVSAKTESALASLGRAYATLLSQPAASPLEDICHSAGAGRSHFEHRLAVVGASARDTAARLADYERSPVSPGVFLGRGRQAPQVGFLFTGQGVHYAGAGRDLFRSSRVFREALERCSAIVSAQAGFSVIAALYDGALSDEFLRRTEYAQPITISIELALAALLRSCGVEPSLVMGHSLGEYAAACFAGIFSVEDALSTVVARARAMQALPETGCMVALECEADAVAKLLRDGDTSVAIAAVNAPTQTVISGRREDVDALCARLPGVRSRLLEVSHAFHSSLMRPMLSDFAEVVARVVYAPPSVGFVSNVTGEVESLEPTTAEYWMRHVLEPVQFRRGIEAMHASGCGTFIEIGPKPTLMALAAQCLPSSGVSLLPGLDPRRPDWRTLLETLAVLYTQGASLDWAGVHGEYGNTDATLPTYPFEHQRYWYVASYHRGDRMLGGSRAHPLLGARAVDATRPDELVFESELSASNPAYLADHEVLERPVFPAAGYIELAFAAGRAAGMLGGMLVKNLRVLAPLSFEENTKRRVRTVLLPTESTDYTLRVLSRDASAEDDDFAEHEWQLHAQATLSPGALERAEHGTLDDAARAALLTRLDATLTAAEAYARAARKGLRYGTAFRTLLGVRSGAHEAFAELELPAGLGDSTPEYVLHPALLDGALQSIGPLLPEDHTYLPEGTESVQLLRPLGRKASVHLKLSSLEENAGELSGELAVYDEAGELAVHVGGLKLKRVSKGMLARARERDVLRLLYRIEWKSCEARERSAAGDGEGASREQAWLLFGCGPGSGPELEQVLRGAGVSPIEVVLEPYARLTRLGPARYAVDPREPSQSLELVRQLLDEGALPSDDCTIVYLAGLDVAPLDEAVAPSLSESHLLGCGPLLNLAQALNARMQRFRLHVVTRGALRTSNAPDRVNVEQGALLGLLATLRAESPGASVRHIDLDPAMTRRTGLGEATRLAAELRSHETEEHVAFRANRRLVARLGRIRPNVYEGPIEVQIREYGSADQLVLCPMQRREPGAGEIEIAVCAAGLNFKDVLHVWGLLKDYCEEVGLPWIDRRKLGFECSGVVTRVGTRVSSVEPGDEVIGIGFECLSSFVTLDATKVVRKPRSIGHAEAAGLPTAYLTAVHALVTLARLKRGQTVLVHAAAGGVGQAALQLCKQLGAEVFATASPPKWDFLNAQGVRRVMSSRTLEFERETLALTEGRGVDVVLNSLPGEFIPASLRTLARGGTFVEIGKRGIWSPEGVADLRPDVQYFTFDLGELDASSGPRFLDQLTRVCEQIDARELAALPVQIFPVTEVADALRTLAEARSVGKVIVEFPVLREQPSERVRSNDESGPAPSEHGIHANASYLITGGLGGLGLEVATWLVRRGARSLALMGRRAPDDAGRARIAELETAGARVQVLLGDVAGPRAELEQTLREVGSPFAPLRGVVHAAGVIDDGLLNDQTWERFERVMMPKVVGAWNLHCLTKNRTLDFFVAFSSVAACLSSPGQANYAAANGFLDALMQARRSAGLPGSSIGWGPWASAGMAARLPKHLRDLMQRHGMAFVSVPRNLAALEFLLETREEAHALVASVNWRVYLRHLAPSSSAGFFADLGEEGASASGAAPAGSDGELESKLAGASELERRRMLMDYIRTVVTKVLRFPAGEVIEPRRGLFDLGMDSLSAVEIKNSVERGLGRAIPSTVMLDFPTLEGLTNHLHDEVLGYGSSTSTRPIAINA